MLLILQEIHCTCSTYYVHDPLMHARTLESSVQVKSIAICNDWNNSLSKVKWISFEGKNIHAQETPKNKWKPRLI
jgi:hypothetical protein